MLLDPAALDAWKMQHIMSLSAQGMWISGGIIKCYRRRLRLAGQWGSNTAMQGLLTQHNFAQLASYLTRAAKRRFGVGHAENMQRVVAGMAGVEHDDGSSSSDTDNAIIDMVAVEDQSD